MVDSIVIFNLFVGITNKKNSFRKPLRKAFLNGSVPDLSTVDLDLLSHVRFYRISVVYFPRFVPDLTECSIDSWLLLN